MLFTKTKSKNLLLKAVSILLCFCIYTSILQLIIISANAVSEPIVTVCFEGEKTKTVTISESEKCEISAVCNEKGNLEYNWQVLGDKKHDLWIDIYDAKSETISVSNALLSGVLDNSGKAEIRATVTKDGITGKSEPVSVTVKKEEFENANNVVYTPTQMLDGKEITEGINYGNQKHSIKVENTGDIKSYIRVKIVSYWVNADGIVVGLPSANVNIEPKSGWIKGDNDIYYYTSAIEPSAFTGILSSPIDLKVSLDANGNTVYQAIDILSEAIQAEPTLAAEEAWGITIDENGMIR